MFFSLEVCNASPWRRVLVNEPLPLRDGHVTHSSQVRMLLRLDAGLASFRFTSVLIHVRPFFFVILR